MSKPSKRDMARQERLEQIRKETESQAIQLQQAAPAGREVSAPAPSPAPPPEPLKAEDSASNRAKGAGVSKILSSMAGGVMGQLKEAETQRDQMAEELATTKAALQDFRMRMEAAAHGGDAGAQLLDPETVRLTAFDNRDPKSFDDDDRDFRDLKADIEAQGGNLIPGLVRPLEEPDGKVIYEVVYGNRRMMACRRLGLPFKTFIQSIPDEDAMLLQHVENAHRKNLSAIETGQKIRSFLDHRRSNSGRVAEGALALLADTLKLNKRHVAKLAMIGSIPERVLAAIPDVRDIPFRPAHVLAKQCRDNLDGVLVRLETVNPSWRSRRVVMHLVAEDNAGSGSSASSVGTRRYRLALPADPEARAQCEEALKALAEKYGLAFQVEDGTDEAT